MIHFKLGKHKYSIPSKWSEVTTGQFLALREAKNDIEMLNILSGIPIDTLIYLDKNSVLRLTLAIAYVKELPKLDNPPEPIDITISFLDGIYNRTVTIPHIKDIKKKTWGQKIKLQNIVNQKTDEFDKILDIVLVYAQPYIDRTKFDPNRFMSLKKHFYDVNFLNLYGLAKDYLEQLHDIITFEKNNLYVEPTNEQKVAGIDRFEKFGVMNTVNASAKNDVLKYEKVLETEYNVMLTHMLIQKEKSEFQKRYSEVMKRKAKRR